MTLIFLSHPEVLNFPWQVLINNWSPVWWGMLKKGFKSPLRPSLGHASVNRLTSCKMCDRTLFELVVWLYMLHCTLCWSYLVQSSMVDWSQILHSLSMRLHFGSFTRSGAFVQNYLARCVEHWTLNNEHWTLHIVHTMLNINIEHWTMFMLHWTWSLSTLRWTSDFTSSSSDFLLDQAMDHKRQRL